MVALLQVYISQERIKRILTTPRKGLNSVLGALLGLVTPFCSCSIIPVLVGLFKSGAPFCGAVSFLLISPILNPAIITLMLAFFGVKATVVYTIFTFAFAVVMGLILDKVGFEKEIKNVSVKGGHPYVYPHGNHDTGYEHRDLKRCGTRRYFAAFHKLI